VLIKSTLKWYRTYASYVLVPVCTVVAALLPLEHILDLDEKENSVDQLLFSIFNRPAESKPKCESTPELELFNRNYNCLNKVPPHFLLSAKNSIFIHLLLCFFS
jgi:hypothetical protein